MWVTSWDAPSLFVSKKANNWRESNWFSSVISPLRHNEWKYIWVSNSHEEWIIVYNYSVVMWVWSSDALSFFVSKRANSWREPPGSRPLLALCDTKNESASENQTDIRKWIIAYNYSVVMWVQSSDALWLFVSRRANNWKEPHGSIQLLALCDTMNESVSEGRTHMRTGWLYRIIHFRMSVWSSDSPSFFLWYMGNNCSD
jgi:hypothetical protein